MDAATPSVVQDEVVLRGEPQDRFEGVVRRARREVIPTSRAGGSSVLESQIGVVLGFGTASDAASSPGTSFMSSL